MRILAVDTTASPVSAAILTDGVLTGEFFLNTKTTHSQTLMPIVETILKTTNTNIKDIDIFAVNAGPGSFTGVRIGVSFIKGISIFSDSKCASVSTLESMAYGLPYEDGIVCAVMDARCKQVYNALFRLNNYNVSRITEDRALSVDELLAELSSYSEKIYMVGDGADMCCEEYSKTLKNIVLTPSNLRYQHAYGTARAAERLAFENKLCTSDSLMPIYLRMPQAERELNAKNLKVTK